MNEVINESNIVDKCNKLNESVWELDKLLVELDIKLSPVLRDGHPVEDKSDNDTEIIDTSSPLSRELVNTTNAINESISKVHTIFERLDIS